MRMRWCQEERYGQVEVQLLLGARLFHPEQPRDVQADVEAARSFDRDRRLCPTGRSVSTLVHLYGDCLSAHEDWCLKTQMY